MTEPIMMTVSEVAAKISKPNGLGRHCGDCTLCCKLLPVQEGVKYEGGRLLKTDLGEQFNAMLPRFVKPANTRCQHQCSKGCRIYKRRPFACRVFSCRWLTGEDTEKLRRPDRTGYVIDMTDDVVLIDDVQTRVVQIWVAPEREHDWRRDAELLAFCSRRLSEGIATIVRYGVSDAQVLWRTSDGEIVLSERHPATTSEELEVALAANGPAKGLPAQQEDQHEQHQVAAPDPGRADHAAAAVHAEDQPEQHQQPEDEADGHGAPSSKPRQDSLQRA